MNRPHVAQAVFPLIVIALIIAPIVTHNDLVSKDEAVDESWGQVQSSYQRRADLIPNLQKTIKRFLEHERETLATVTNSRESGVEELEAELDALTEARQEAFGPDNLSDSDEAASEETVLAIARRQQQLGQRMRGVIARVEAYPQLRSSDQFLRLQSQLEGTENRINIARQRYNEAVSAHNSALRGFPGHWLAASMGLEPRPYFKADEGADEAPELAF